MRQKINSISDRSIYNSVKGSFLWVLLLFSYAVFAQKIVEKRIHSDLEHVLIEFDLIDHIEVFNSTGTEIVVRAESQFEVPNFLLTENKGKVFIKAQQVLKEQESFEEDKVCSVEPNYVSYQIYIPQNKVLYISFTEGNFYADGYQGVLNLNVEDGIVKLNSLGQHTHIELNTGSIYVNNVVHKNIKATTNLGELMSDLTDKNKNQGLNSFERKGAETDTSLTIKAIMANIYLYGSKG